MELRLVLEQTVLQLRATTRTSARTPRAQPRVAALRSHTHCAHAHIKHSPSKSSHSPNAQRKSNGTCNDAGPARLRVCATSACISPRGACARGAGRVGSSGSARAAAHAQSGTGASRRDGRRVADNEPVRRASSARSWSRAGGAISRVSTPHASVSANRHEDRFLLLVVKRRDDPHATHAAPTHLGERGGDVGAACVVERRAAEHRRAARAREPQRARALEPRLAVDLHGRRHLARERRAARASVKARVVGGSRYPARHDAVTTPSCPLRFHPPPTLSVSSTTAPCASRAAPPRSPTRARPSESVERTPTTSSMPSDGDSRARRRRRGPFRGYDDSVSFRCVAFGGGHFVAGSLRCVALRSAVTSFRRVEVDERETAPTRARAVHLEATRRRPAARSRRRRRQSRRRRRRRQARPRRPRASRTTEDCRGPAWERP